MRIEIKYRSSQGPHIIDLSRADLEGLECDTREVRLDQGSPAKSLVIQRTSEELRMLVDALTRGAGEAKI